MKHLILSGILAWATVAAAQENPVFKLFPQDVKFHLSFDDATCNSEMAEGKAEPIRTQGTPVFGKGILGKALVSGIPSFDAAKNLDMTIPGTVILWVTPVNWPTEKPESGKEPGFTAFAARGNDKTSGYDYIIGKMGGQPWGAGHMNTYIQYSPATIKHVNCIVYDAGQAKKWKNGEWKMLVTTWTPGSFTNSVNGKKSQSSALKTLLSQPTASFQIGTARDGNPYTVMTDEVTILKRALTDAEIQKLYEETVKAAGIKQ